MATSIADLLDGLHHTAWATCRTAPEQHAATTSGLLASWPDLASATRRAIENIPLDPDAGKFTASLRTTLRQIAAQRRAWRTDAKAEPNEALRAMTVRIGAIADLLTDAPRPHNDNDRLAGMGLVANLAAPIHAATTWTLALADQAPGFSSTRWLFRQLAGHTQPYLHTRPADRVGRYDDLTVPRSDEHTLDAALHRWTAATLDELGSPWRVTRASLQTAAVDLVLLTAAAAHITWAGIYHGLIDREHGHAALDALRAANEAWRTAATWPAQLRLDGARIPGNAETSADLHGAITATLRSGLEWATPHEITQRTDLTSLLRTMREGMRAAEDVANTHYRALRQHVFGTNRLWVAAQAVETDQPLDTDLLGDRRRRRWTPRPLEERGGLHLLEAAAVAANDTITARQVIETPPVRSASQPVREPDLVGGRLTADRLPSDLGPWEVPTMTAPAGHDGRAAHDLRPRQMHARSLGR